MTPLQPPDTHHVSAAHGWLELGNPTEAGVELTRIDPQHLNHPEVLEVRWMVCAATDSWSSALEVANLLWTAFPELASGWLHRSYAMRRIPGGSLVQAWEALLPAYEKFPKTSVVPFNLACYAAQMGRLDEAWDWLHRAMESEGDVVLIKKMALADSDLRALWERIRTI